MDEIKELEIEIQKEICRLQLLDYINESTYDYLDYLKKDLKKLKEPKQ